MKGCAVFAPTLWLVATGLLVGRPTSTQFASAGIFGTATVLTGAIITNAYISIDNVARPAQGVAWNDAGRSV